MARIPIGKLSIYDLNGRLKEEHDVYDAKDIVNILSRYAPCMQIEWDETPGGDQLIKLHCGGEPGTEEEVIVVYEGEYPFEDESVDDLAAYVNEELGL